VTNPAGQLGATASGSSLKEPPLRGRDILAWARQLTDAIVLGDVAAAAAVGTAHPARTV